MENCGYAERSVSMVCLLAHLITHIFCRIQRSFLQQFLATILFPMNRFIPIIERSFGTGISSFYDFWISIINLNIVLFILNLGLLMIPWFITVRNFGALASWNLLLGLIGSDSTTIGKSWFYYGGYPAWSGSTPPYYFALVYTLCVIFYLAFSLIIIVVNIGVRVRRVSNLGLFPKRIFNK